MGNIAAAQTARLSAALDRFYRNADGTIETLRDWLAKQPQLEKATGDGMIDWSRTHFNRLDHRQQAEYEARLKARKYYYVNDRQVPKIVWDSIG